VHLHRLAFGVRERPGLVEHLVLHAHLPHVVQVGAEPDRGLGVLVQTKLLGDGEGKGRDALAVSEGVAVVRLDRLTPLAHHGEVSGLELGHLAVDVDEITAGIEPAEQGVGLVQQPQGVLIAAHRLVEDRELPARRSLVQD